MNAQGGYNWTKRVVIAAVWLVMISFIATWIYEYDACKQSSSSTSPQALCLGTSLVSAYFTWLLMALAWFLKAVAALL